MQILNLLLQETKLKKEQINNILNLFEQGYSIPFIARYRKEMTGGVSDEELRDFEDIYIKVKKLLNRKEEITRLIDEKSALNENIKKSIQEAQSLKELEHIYKPYRDKKSTRASVAIDNGLLDLAKAIKKATLSINEFNSYAKGFINKNISNIDAAIKGAQDILAQEYADSLKTRQAIKNIMTYQGILEISKAKKFNEKGVYKNFLNTTQKVSTIPSHRYLAIMRGVNEKELSVKITINTDKIHENIKEYKIPKEASKELSKLLFDAYKEGLKRLLMPSIQREIFSELKDKADTSAIATFGKNLSQLLMIPPVVNRVILGVDPGFRTGCKLAVIDENANFLDQGVIYPTQPKNDYENSKNKILELVKKYNINAIAIGNATASRETQEFFAKLNKDEHLKLNYTVVSEAGASVYSASKIASQEYPDLDVTIRGAISIAQRLRDPMATFVKIDPKSLGIGQYQHDVDQKLLEKKLTDTTEDIVNRIGVDINSASASLLSYVAGIGDKIAKNIIAFRDEIGTFSDKKQLLKVKGLGEKAYEQCAGFIRIKNSKNPFNNTGIHPEHYNVASKIKNLDLKNIDIKSVSNELNIGQETLRDIVKELLKPGFDPRQELPPIPFKEGITDISMLKEGSFISGVVRNIADFGAFVDIGLKNDGMIHISKISQKHIASPLEVLSLNQFLPQIQVVSIDKERQKVGLSLI